MKSEKDEILCFLHVLASHPDHVQVTKIDGNPVIFEIRACKDDLADLASKQTAIQAIATSTGLKKGRFMLKFLESECPLGPHPA